MIGIEQRLMSPNSETNYNPLPNVATLRDLLTHYLDIRAVPRLSFFEFCRHFASDEREREKLEEFSSLQGQVSCASVYS